MSLINLEKKINSELNTKINSSRINHEQLEIQIDKESLLDVVIFLKKNNSNKFKKLIDIKTFNREKDKSDVHKGFGLNFKITDLQSSLGLSQLSKLEEFIKMKKNLHRQYSNNLNDQKY